LEVANVAARLEVGAEVWAFWSASVSSPDPGNFLL